MTRTPQANPYRLPPGLSEKGVMLNALKVLRETIENELPVWEAQRQRAGEIDYAEIRRSLARIAIELKTARQDAARLEARDASAREDKR